MRTRLLLALLAATACTSPEAGRERGGGPGADPGNRNPVVEMHQGAEPYHRTPCRMTDVDCEEPGSVWEAPRTPRES